MAQIIGFRHSTSITLDGSGNGTASIGPMGHGVVWLKGFVVSVICSSNTSEAICSFYVGDAAVSEFYAGGTSWGSTGDSGVSGADLHAGGQVFAVWSGGTPGATATLVVTGQRQVA